MPIFCPHCLKPFDKDWMLREHLALMNAHYPRPTKTFMCVEQRS